MENKEALKLLVVDDEEGIVDYTQRIYKRQGFITFGATDGASAVELFKKERPDITLIDVHMPHSSINGIETLRQIKAMNKNAICIMITRVTDKEQVEEAKKLGALHYLVKPFGVEQLNKVVDEAKELLKR